LGKVLEKNLEVRTMTVSVGSGSWNRLRIPNLKDLVSSLGVTYQVGRFFKRINNHQVGY
jgi:acetylglutamate synthase